VSPVVGSIQKSKNGAKASRGFNLIDTLVSVAVIAVLISLLLPTLSGVNESARRVVCASNVRQIGFGIALYSEANQGAIPRTVYLGQSGRRFAASDRMMTLRMDRNGDSMQVVDWDGLGLLYAGEYLNAPKIYYCPSHTGNYRFQEMVQRWETDGRGDVVGNYHYRGSGPDGETKLYHIEPGTTALVGDGMRTLADYNHRVGSNLLMASLNVRWIEDGNRQLASSLARNDNEVTPGKIEDAWDWIDQQLGTGAR
jgi:competence protein ComGC